MAHRRIVPGANAGTQVNRSWLALLRLWRTLTNPVVQGDLTLSSSATINAQFWFSQFPLRPTAAWAAVAALLAAGSATLGLSLGWRELALLLLLVDPLWGAIWRLAAGRLELLPLRERDRTGVVWLPYLKADSPAARLLGWDDNGVLHLIMRVALPERAFGASRCPDLGCCRCMAHDHPLGVGAGRVDCAPFRRVCASRVAQRGDCSFAMEFDIGTSWGES